MIFRGSFVQETCFTSFGADLPAPTLIVIAMVDFFVKYWYIVFGLCCFGGIYFLVQAWKRSPKVQAFVDPQPAQVAGTWRDAGRRLSIARWSRNARYDVRRRVARWFEALDSVGPARRQLRLQGSGPKSVQTEVKRRLRVWRSDAEHWGCSEYGGNR